jgi:2-dehydro-3-deoxygluconokinase
MTAASPRNTTSTSLIAWDGGDSFGGALIYALLQEYGCQDAIEFAVAASCLKHSIQGDYNRVTADEVRALMKGSGSGRVER